MENEISKKLAEHINGGREYRRTQNIEVRAGEDDEKVVTGYACTFDEPYLLYDGGDYKSYEKIDRHAFDECDMSDVIMQYDHVGRVFARKSNSTLKLETDAHGLHTEANLGGTAIGAQLYEEIKGGYTNKMSFGFRVGADERERNEHIVDGITIVEIMRTITKISKLYDVSAVSLPANDGTEISARSFCDGVIEELKAERLKEAERRRKIKILKLMLED